MSLFYEKYIHIDINTTQNNQKVKTNNIEKNLFDRLNHTLNLITVKIHLIDTFISIFN